MEYLMRRVLYFLIMLVVIVFATAEARPDMLYWDAARPLPDSVPLPRMEGHAMSLTLACTGRVGDAPLGISVVNEASDTLVLSLSVRRSQDNLYSSDKLCVSVDCCGISSKSEADAPYDVGGSGNPLIVCLEANPAGMPGRLALRCGRKPGRVVWHSGDDGGAVSRFMDDCAPAWKTLLIKRGRGVEIERASLRYVSLPVPFSEPLRDDGQIAELLSFASLKDSTPAGYWQLLDYDTEGTLLRPGGRYTLAIVPDGSDGYDILYLSGAEINPGRWKRGMPKGKMRPTSSAGVYALVWYDAEGEPLSRQAEISYGSPGVLVITFPHLNSSMRLQRLRNAEL